jgi:hypothetical protein
MWLIAFVVLGSLLVLGVGVSFRANAWLRRVGQMRPAACAGTAPLIPLSEDGRPWQPHRYSLSPGEVEVGQHDSYLVWNQRTGEMFRWGRERKPSMPVRVLVPTRYAEMINRGWRDDPWAYCLVLAPDPPFLSRYWGFETSIEVAPVEVAAGGAATIDAYIEGEHATRSLITVEVHDGSGARVAQWVWDDQPLLARTRARYTVRWDIPGDTAPGLYVVKIGVFVPGSGKLRHWNDGTAVLFVQPSPAPRP